MRLLLTHFDEHNQVIGQRIHSLGTEYFASALPYLILSVEELEIALQRNNDESERFGYVRDTIFNIRAWMSPVTGEYRDCRTKVEAIY